MKRSHPYIPNLAPGAREAMLSRVGVESTEQLYEAVPEDVRFERVLEVGEALASEAELRAHVEGLLARNRSADDLISFLGGGCWQHDVPAVCDEIVGRAEFLSAYGGGTYADLGKYQAIFEFQSLMGELLDMDVVSAPSYDGTTAAASALLMATRLTGRREVAVARSTSPELRRHLPTMFGPAASPRPIAYDRVSGRLDRDDLERRIDGDVAAVYLEMPTYLGVLEERPDEIAELAHRAGALLVVGVDPTSLGVLAPPATYAADIVCGEIQGLGVHMQYGGGVCGFIASQDDPDILAQYPTFLISITEGDVPGEFGYGWSTTARMSYERREGSTDFTGSSQWLWGIAAAVYLSLMGPSGMRELGETILARSHYAAARLDTVPGVRSPALSGSSFKDVVVDVNATGRSASELVAALIERGFLAGRDLSADFPELGQALLVAVTEARTQAEIDQLVDAFVAEVA